MAKLPKRINSSEQSFQRTVQKAIEKKNFVEVNIDSIKSPKYHDRKYIDKNTIYELSESILSTKGLIYPIVVRELKDGTLERMIGYRRIEAYKLLERKTIPTIILKNVSDKQALLLMTTENMQRENLSLYDETLALIDYVAVSLEVSPEEVERLLNRFKNFKSGVLINSIDTVEKDKYYKIEEILKKTGKIAIGTLINRLKKTKVQKLLQISLSRGEMTFAVAQVLNTIEDEEVLSTAIDKVLKENLSKRETMQYIKTLIPNSQDKNENDFSKKIKDVGKLKLEKLSSEKQKVINALVEKILLLAES